MMRLQPRTIIQVFLGITYIPLVALHSIPIAQAIQPENVLVLYNADDGQDGDGAQIANYYQQLRPGVHTLGISGVNSTLIGPTDELIDAQDYLDVIRPQVLAGIDSIPDSIDVIVTTKGMPLRIRAIEPDNSNAYSWERFSSLESELTRIDSIETIDQMGEQFFQSGFPPQIDPFMASNPYYNTNVPFVRDGIDPFHEDIRLSARLDGYSVESVRASLDRAQEVYVVPYGQYIVADDKSASNSIDQINEGGISGIGPGMGLENTLNSLYGTDSQFSPLLYDESSTAITSTDRPVLGYVSHGTNDGSAADSLGDKYLGKFVSGIYEPGEVDFEFTDGAIFHTYESFNAVSFNPINDETDALVADWIELGGTAGLGHVAEPGNDHERVTNEDLLFEMMLPSGGGNAQPGDTGLTFVEAAWNATRQLSFVNTVVGDPLMTYQAWLPGDANLDQKVDSLDLGLLLLNWFKEGGYTDGDFNGDGFVNLSDFGVLQYYWGTDLTKEIETIASTAFVTIPEPSTLILLMTLFAFQSMTSRNLG